MNPFHRSKYLRKKALLTSILLIVLLVTSALLQSTAPVFGAEANSAPDSAAKSEPLESMAVSSAEQLYSSWSGKAAEGQGGFVAASDTTTEIVVGLPQNSIEGSHLDLNARLYSLINAFQGKIVNKVSMGGRVVALVVKAPLGVASLFSKELKSSGLARYVEPNQQFFVDSVPNDPSWSLQWGPKKIKADYAWNTTAGLSSVLVAVIDTGIDYNHPDLSANYVPLGYDWVNNDAFPMDDHNHGTFCAGEIAAKINNTVGIAGLAQVRIMAEKGLNAAGSGWEDDLANAIIHATDAGANILSNSWGSASSSSLIHDAIIYATNHGALVIAAAGNTGANEQHYPGAYDEVVGVTATASNDAPASFTTYGTWYDVAAPGVDIYSTIRVAAGSYGYMSGTSMAAPHAAGVAALIWSRFNGTSAAAVNANFVRAQLESTADDLGSAGRDIYYGNGRINAQNAVEQVPQAHDLIIQDLQTPLFGKIGVSNSFIVTVKNNGLNGETGLQIQLLANNSLVSSANVASLSSFTATSVTLTWVPASLGIYNITAYAVPVPGETAIQNNRLSKNLTINSPPANGNWVFLAQDPDEGSGTNLKTLHGQLSSGILYFKIAHYRRWVVASDSIDTAIFIDADQNPSTGLPDHIYPGQNLQMGADYVIVAGYEGFEMWKWSSSLGWWNTSSPFILAYVDAPDYSNVLILGLYLADVQTNGALNIAVADIPSNWDYMPDSRYSTFYTVRNQHDLAVTLGDTPVTLEPLDTSLLSASLTNLGLDIEANAVFQLLINGTIVSGLTGTNMSPMSTYRIDHMWTPSVAGIYNVTAYAIPVPGETATANNVRTAFVQVRSISVALISDNQELSLSNVPAILDSVNVGYDLYDYNNYNLFTASSSILSRYPIVIFDNYNRNINEEERSTLQAYIAGGGNLLVTGYDSLGSPSDPYLAEVVRSSMTGDNVGEPDLYVRSPTHPIMNGPYGSFSSGYHVAGLFSDQDSAEANTSLGAVTVAELADGRDKIIATQSYPGRVVYWNGKGESDWSGNAACQTMFKNLMAWFQTAQASSVYFAVRGLTNGINYTSYNIVSRSLDEWTALPGATSISPAAAKVGDEMHFVVKAASSNALYHGFVNMISSTFSGWSLLGETSNTAPTLTSNGTMLFLVLRTPSNAIKYSMYNPTTRAWSAWNALPGTTYVSLGAAAINNELHVAVKGASSNALYHGYVNTASGTFSGWSLLSETSTITPALTSNGTMVFSVVRNPSGLIRYSRYSLATRTWGAWTTLPGSTAVSPGAVAIHNELHVAVKGASSPAIYHGYVNLNSGSFSGWTLTNGLTTSAPTLTK